MWGQHTYVAVEEPRSRIIGLISKDEMAVGAEHCGITPRRVIGVINWV